jgi:hypothetical protein
VERAAQLCGAAGSLCAKIGRPLPPVERAEYSRDLATARAQLDEAAFKAEQAAGRQMTLDEAIRPALSEV